MKIKKRILIVSSMASSLINFRLELIKDFIKIGYEVHVAAPDIYELYMLKVQFDNMGVKSHKYSLSRTGFNPLNDLYSLFNLYYIIVRTRPNIVFSYTIKPVIYATLASWLARVPNRCALVTGLGYAFIGSANGIRKILKSIVMILCRLSLKHSSTVIFQNPDDRDLFLRYKLIQSTFDTMVVNGSGVDIDHFRFSPLKTKNINFLMIARLLGDKGVREYVEAARIIRLRYPNVKFSLAGWIDSNPNSISSNELNGWIDECVISFLGKLDDVREAISNCSVYVLPSYREGTPRSVLEAMAIGRPIITTNAPGCKETVIDGYNGFLVPIKSANDLVNAMLEFVYNPALITNMGVNSRKIAEDKYDVRKVNHQMLNHLKVC